MDLEQIKAIAHGEADASDQEWELDRLEWDLDLAMPLDRFLDLMSAEDWKQWLWNEEQAARDDGRSGYLHLLAGKIIEPVVAILDQKGEKPGVVMAPSLVVDIWDGWYRTAACIKRGPLSLSTPEEVLHIPLKRVRHNGLAPKGRCPRRSKSTI